MPSLKNNAYNAIKNNIANCVYLPGSELSEEQLKKELNVSRTPIRDALGRLEQEGLIIIRPKKGIKIAPLSVSEINQVFEIRTVLESYALRNYGNSLDIEFLFEQYRFATRTDPSSKECFSNDDLFHSVIVKAIGNHYVDECYRTINVQNQRLRILSGFRQERLNATMQEHQAIIRACLEKNWEEAAEAMEKHLTNSKNASLEMLLANGNPYIQESKKPGTASKK